MQVPVSPRAGRGPWAAHGPGVRAINFIPPRPGGQARGPPAAGAREPFNWVQAVQGGRNEGSRDSLSGTWRLASSQAQAEGNHKVAQLELEHNPLTTCALVAYLHMLRLLLRLGLAEENLSLP